MRKAESIEESLQELGYEEKNPKDREKNNDEKDKKVEEGTQSMEMKPRGIWGRWTIDEAKTKKKVEKKDK